MIMPVLSDDQRQRITSIGDSYRRLTGRPLVDATGDVVEALWSAPKVIVAHGIEPDPIFFFGNHAALTLFEMEFAAFTRLASRFSAEPAERDARVRFLQRLTRDDMIVDYAGVRVSATGKRFQISNVSVWNLRDQAGTPIGQAAAFSDWAYLPAL